MCKKLHLRRSLLAARNAIPAEIRHQSDTAISARVVAWWRANPVATLGVYWPIKSEPDLQASYATLAQLGAQLALPVVIEKAAPLRFACWAPGDPLEKDAMGIAIPAAPQRWVLPDALLIPCVGFNAQRLRLGYGGGFYDRTLAAGTPTKAVGIAYAAALAAFDGDPHDVALDCVITETGIY